MGHRMMRRLLAATGVVLLTAVNQTSAMGLLQAYDAALQNDPVYRSAVFENQAGQQYRVLGRAALLPTLQYSYASSQNRADTTEPNFFGAMNTTHPEYTSITSSLSVRQTLFNLDAMARYRQGMARTHYSDALFARQRQDLIVRLVVAYAEARFAQEQLALYTAQRDTLAEQRRVNDRLFEKGEGTKTDMLETQARLDVAQARLVEAENSLASARATLSAMTGPDISPLDGLSSDFRALPLPSEHLEDWQAWATRDNAELAQGRLGVEVADHEISRNRAGHAPRLDLNASYSHTVADSLTNYNRDSTIRSIGVQLVLPLYSGGAVEASSMQAVAMQAKAQSDLEASTRKVMIEVQKQLAAVKSGVSKIDALQKAVNSATELVYATQQSVKVGARINLDVLNAQQELQAAQRDLLQARYNYLISALKLRLAAGSLNLDDVREVASQFSSER
jgi:protease secretion system outer membrane protein